MLKSGDVLENKYRIDDIDRVLAKYYGFMDEVQDFIISFNIQYRLGLDSQEG